MDTAPDKKFRVRLGLTLIIYSGIRLCTATGAVSLITASTALIMALSKKAYFASYLVLSLLLMLY